MSWDLEAMNLSQSDTFLRTDPRTLGWPLVDNKVFIAVTLVSYVYTVKIGGPHFMKDRKPFNNLKPAILLYNASMVLLNIFFGTSFLFKTYIGGGYNIVCQGIDFDARDETTMSFLRLTWWYVLVRIADFLDTIFFVLRKKDSHVTFLHVSHHTMVVFTGWFALGHGADGQVALGLIINCYVHVLMYSYYFLSLLGPSVRQYLWWKRYLTQLQMIQFLVMIGHGIIALVMDCGYPKSHALIGLPQVLLVLCLFLNFYYKSYQAQRANRERLSSKVKSQECLHAHSG